MRWVEALARAGDSLQVDRCLPRANSLLRGAYRREWPLRSSLCGHQESSSLKCQGSSPQLPRSTGALWWPGVTSGSTSRRLSPRQCRATLYIRDLAVWSRHMPGTSDPCQIPRIHVGCPRSTQGTPIPCFMPRHCFLFTRKCTKAWIPPKVFIQVTPF